MLVVFRGLPGSGKTHLVRRLVRSRPGFLVLSRDNIRASIVPRPTFAAEEKDLIDDVIVSMAGFLLDRSRDVVIDGMALSSAARVEEFVRAAGARGKPVRVIECVCTEATALSRIGRDRGGHPAGDRGAALYLGVKARYEPLSRPFLSVNTEGDASRALALILDYIDAEQATPGGEPGHPAAGHPR